MILKFKTKYFKFYLCSIFYVLTIGTIVNGQTLLVNDVVFPQSSQKSAACSGSSVVFNNKYNGLPFYVPNANTPVKTILININVFRDNNGLNMFSNDAATLSRLNQIVQWTNNLYQNNATPSDPVPGVSYIGDSKVRFVLNNIYFYNNTSANQSTNLTYLLNIIKTTDPARANQLNICFTNGTGSSPYAYTPSFSDINYEQGYIGFPSNSGDYAIALNMGHELGHCLNLLHTYYGSCCPESCNSSDIDFLADVFNSTITPSCAPLSGCNICYHDAGWSMNPTIVGNTATNNLMGGTQNMGYLSPKQMGKIHKALSLSSIRRYVSDDSYSSSPLTINALEIWDFDTRIYSDINLSAGGKLSVLCGLAMPYKSQIVVSASSSLTIDNANIVSASYPWKGITVQNGGSLTLNNTTLKDYSITIKSGGTLIINSNLTLHNDCQINVESGGYICFNASGIINLQNTNNVINLHSGYIAGVNTAYVPAISTCRAPNTVAVTGSGKINYLFNTNLYLQNTSISTNLYYVGNYIYAGSNVTTAVAVGPVKILSTAKVTLDADQDIIITPEFETFSGCSFEMK